MHTHEKILLSFEALLFAFALIVSLTGQVLVYQIKIDASGKQEFLGGTFVFKHLSQLSQDSKGGIFSNPLFYYFILFASAIAMFLTYRLDFGGMGFEKAEIHKTLSSKVRLHIINLLEERRMTLSELSERTGVALPGVKRHLEELEGKGFIKKIDEGRKWKYYELTDNGRKMNSNF